MEGTYLSKTFSRSNYALVSTVADKLVLLTSLRFGKQLWAESTTRNETDCVLCEGRILKGEQVYRPMTNMGNRMERMHAACLGNAIAQLKPTVEESVPVQKNVER